MKKIAIIGFGFCGKMVFAHLAKKFPEKFELLIFDAAEEGFSSKAFAQFSPHYILNVPANRMSAFSEKAEDFCQFLHKNYEHIFKEIGQSGFAPRHIYAQYLQEIIDESRATKMAYQILKTEVVAVTQNDENFTLTTKNGDEFFADEVVMATSFVQSKFPWEIASPNAIKSLWSKDSLPFHQKNFSDEKICLIGSGLTTVDLIVGLKNKNFRGKIFVVSRRGNFPQKHFSQPKQLPNFIVSEDAKKGVLFLCLKVRNFLLQNPQFDLRHVVDSVRPITKNLWHNFDEKNKKLFMKIFPYWNIFRHRAPQNSIGIIEEMIATKQLELCSGGVKEIFKNGEKFCLRTKTTEFEVDYLVNCLGFEFNAKKYLLLNQMINCGLLQPDLMMVRSNHKKVHLLGGMNIGRDFECTAVPDLRADVEKLIPLLCLD